MRTSLFAAHQAHIDLIATRASELHASVNQFYGHDLPYAFHLRLAASYLTRFSDEIPMDEDNIETLYAAIYFHDSLEDTRITYNDLKKLFQQFNQPRWFMRSQMIKGAPEQKGQGSHTIKGFVPPLLLPFSNSVTVWLMCVSQLCLCPNNEWCRFIVKKIPILFNRSQLMLSHQFLSR